MGVSRRTSIGEGDPVIVWTAKGPRLARVVSVKMHGYIVAYSRRRREYHDASVCRLVMATPGSLSPWE